MQKRMSEYDFKKEHMLSSEFRPVFFLSTGRTGTAFYTELLNQSDRVKVFHSPSALLCHAKSELITQGKVAYEMFQKYGYEDERVNRLLEQVFMAAREELLYKSCIHQKRYIETNNRITFLAPAIKKCIPHAKFVHIYRHPGEFVRSGIRRNYYGSSDTHQLGMITPLQGNEGYECWSEYENYEKVGWLWNETNRFVDDYLQTLDSSDYIQVNFNELSLEQVTSLMRFLEIDAIDEVAIERAIAQPVNAQVGGSFPLYDAWTDEQKHALDRICGTLAKKLGYVLV